MKKINIKLLIVTSLLTMMPIPIGLLLWNKLPERLATHFGVNGLADGFSSKAEAVLWEPMIMLGLHIFAVVMTSFDPKAKNVSPKMRKIVYWLVPVFSVLVQMLVYGNAIGLIHNNNQIGGILIGGVFIVLGNYLPKTKLNYTIGIRLPWTLDNEENWNKTHRLAGKLWVVGGLVLLFSSFVSWTVPYIAGIVLVSIILIPCLYSYWLSRVGQAHTKQK